MINDASVFLCKTKVTNAQSILLQKEYAKSFQLTDHLLTVACCGIDAGTSSS